MKRTVYNACDLLDSKRAKELLSGKRLGLVTNMSGVTRDLKSSSSRIASLYNLSAIFTPEHGLRGTHQAGGYEESQFSDPETGVTVYDLFGGKLALRKAEKIISSLDALLFDIQDIGTRYYTYQFTLLDVLNISKSTSVPLIVLDRINPLGANDIKGNLLEPDCISQTGRVPGQPTVYGMTIGELALWFNDYMAINADVTVLPCDGLTRALIFEDTDLLFVPPSPNMPTPDTIFLYAGTCLFEGTNISEGRGTTKPFELFGAPWIEPERLIEGINLLPPEAREVFEGIVFRPCSFIPTFSDYKGELCNGLQLHIRHKKSVDMYATGLYLLSVIRDLYPKKIEFTDDLAMLAGTKKILKEDFNPLFYLNSQKTEIDNFREQRKPYLLY